MKNKSMLSLGIVALSLLLGSTAFAALLFPATTVATLKDRVRTGPCADAAKNKFHKEVCEAYGLKANGKALKWGVSQPNPSLIILEKSGHIIKIERTETNAEYLINSVRIDIANKDLRQVQSLLQNALVEKSGRYSPWVTPAYAAPLDPAVTAVIQELITETSKYAECSFYLDFGKTCVAGMKNVLAEIDKKKSERSEAQKHPNGFVQMQGRTSALTQLTHLNGLLLPLSEKMENEIAPTYRTEEMFWFCASMTSRPKDFDGAEASMDECRKMIKMAVEKTGGAPEAKKTDGIFKRAWNRWMGNASADESASGGQDGGGGAQSAEDGRE